MVWSESFENPHSFIELIKDDEERPDIVAFMTAVENLTNALNPFRAYAKSVKRRTKERSEFITKMTSSVERTRKGLPEEDSIILDKALDEYAKKIVGIVSLAQYYVDIGPGETLHSQNKTIATILFNIS